MDRFRPLVVAVASVALIVSVGGVYAQFPGGGSRPAPSGMGGNVGSPGMSGAAMSAGSALSSMAPPSVPSGGSLSGSLPSGGGQASGRLSGAASAAGANLGSGAGANVGSGAAGAASGLVGRFSGGGFTPPSGEGGAGLAARLGERGSGNLALSSFLPGEGQTWLDVGGFGTRSEGGLVSGILANLEGMPWHSSDNVPAAPAAFDEITALIEAQLNAQSQANSEAVAQAANQAQAAYDTFWADYYAAVDYTAQVYYETMTASVDYLLQAYDEALYYTAQAVTYYEDYAEQYAAYCAAYPWDCYSYVYDASTNTYIYVGEVSDAPAGTTEVGEVTALTSYPVEALPEPSAEAYEAIVMFANDQLGAVVEPLYAGVATEDVQALISQLPPEMQAYLLNTTTISGAAYWGLLNGGVAGVAVGDCGGASGCVVTAETLTLQLSSASAGAYGLLASAAVPTTANDALALITRVYPKLEGLSFSQITDVDEGFAFTATAAGLGLDPASGQPLSVVKVVYAGVVDTGGQPFVYALVAVGEGYAQVVTS